MSAVLGRIDRQTTQPRESFKDLSEMRSPSGGHPIGECAYKFRVARSATLPSAGAV